MAASHAQMKAWLPWVLPVGAAIAHVFMGEAGHWILRVVSGALAGLSLSLLLWQARTVPPYSAWLGGFAAAALCASMLLLAVFAWRSDLGTYVVILAVTVMLGWALTR
jgi:hypothetical protein